MRTARLGWLALSAMVITLLLAACGTSSGSSNATSSASAASSAGSTSGSAKSGTTEPGTGLSFGQTATVTYTPLTSSGNGKPRTLKITVASIRSGSAADLKALDVSGAPKGALPQYATVTVTNLGPLSIDVDGTSDAIQGIDHGGNPQDPVSFIGDFPPAAPLS